MLTERRFIDLYRQSRTLRDEGADPAAREILFHLFDRGRDAGGYGVARLTFVLRDLAGLAGVGRSGERSQEAQRGYQGLVERRDARETKAQAGEAAFVELQELVALNRSLGEKERSFSLFRKLQGDEDRQDTAKVLGDLLRDELTPRDPRLLAEEIERQRLGEHLSHFVALSRALADKDRGTLARENPAEADPAAKQASARHFEQRHQWRRAAGRVRELAASLGGGDDSADGFVGGTWALTDPRRLTPALEDDKAGRARLQGLADEGDELLGNANLDGGTTAGEELYRQVLEVAAEVAESISNLRVQEDFGDNGDRPKLQRAIQDYAERRVRQDGLLVYEVFLRLDEPGSAERMAAWLLAYRQDEDMYLALIQAARRAGQPEVEEELNEEAQRVLIAG